METLVGRVVKNAAVNTTKTDKQVVNFSIAVNDNYKPKGGTEVKKVRFFNCAYWVATGIAQHLTKGALVELNGRIEVNQYVNMEGKTIASLAMHVNNIKLHGKGAGKNTTAAQPAAAPVDTENTDDLPF